MPHLRMTSDWVGFSVTESGFSASGRGFCAVARENPEKLLPNGLALCGIFCNIISNNRKSEHSFRDPESGFHPGCPAVIPASVEGGKHSGSEIASSPGQMSPKRTLPERFHANWSCFLRCRIGDGGSCSSSSEPGIRCGVSSWIKLIAESCGICRKMAG